MKISGIAAKMLAAYVEWHAVLSRHVPKNLRYSLGVRVDALCAEVIESIASAQFSDPSSRMEKISGAIVKNDTLKFMLYALRELGGLEEKSFLSLSLKFEEIGRMLWGWKQNASKQNRPKSSNQPVRGGNEKE